MHIYIYSINLAHISTTRKKSSVNKVSDYIVSSTLMSSIFIDLPCLKEILISGGPEKYS